MKRLISILTVSLFACGCSTGWKFEVIRPPTVMSVQEIPVSTDEQHLQQHTIPAPAQPMNPPPPAARLGAPRPCDFSKVDREAKE